MNTKKYEKKQQENKRKKKIQNKNVIKRKER